MDSTLLFIVLTLFDLFNTLLNLGEAIVCAHYALLLIAILLRIAYVYWTYVSAPLPWLKSWDQVTIVSKRTVQLLTPPLLLALYTAPASAVPHRMA